METDKQKIIENILLKNTIRALEQVYRYCNIKDDSLKKVISILKNKIQVKDIFTENVELPDILLQRINYSVFSNFAPRVITAFRVHNINNYGDLLVTMLFYPDKLLKTRNIGLYVVELIARHLKDLGIIDGYTIDSNKKLYITSSAYEKFIIK